MRKTAEQQESQRDSKRARHWVSVVAAGVVLCGCSAVHAQGALTTGTGVYSNQPYTGAGGGRGGVQTLPYRDPWLDPSFQTDYTEPSEIERWAAPGETWQIGVPVWHYGHRAYVVRDIGAYLAQFDPSVTGFLVPLPAGVTGYPVDLVVDSRAPVSGVRTSITNAYNGRVSLGTGYVSDGFLKRVSYSGSRHWRYAQGLMPWYWYWVDWTEEDLKRFESARSSYRGSIDGQWVPGYVPIEKQPELAPVLTARERGVAAIRAGDEAAAILDLLEHLNSVAGDGDWAGRRILGVALLADRRVDDAAALMRLAYLGEPSLAHEPIDVEVSGAPGERDPDGESGFRLRLLAGDAGRYANQADSASGWFLLTVILQAQGRNKRGLEVLERAERWGLEAEIVGPMRAAMGG